jgi:ElaA protein
VTTAPTASAHLVVHEALFRDLPARVLYEILRVRIDVFVVEQACAFGDLDGRDLEATARHVWLEDPATPDAPIAGYLRLLDNPDGSTEIGRVVTPLAHRGTGTGHRLMAEAMARIEGPMYLKAQSRKSGFYASFGFVVCGEEFLEDDIPHVPMRHPGN